MHSIGSKIKYLFDRKNMIFIVDSLIEIKKNSVLSGNWAVNINYIVQADQSAYFY
jgi:hypothetical protein